MGEKHLVCLVLESFFKLIPPKGTSFNPKGAHDCFSRRVIVGLTDEALILRAPSLDFYVALLESILFTGAEVRTEIWGGGLKPANLRFPVDTSHIFNLAQMPWKGNDI